MRIYENYVFRAYALYINLIAISIMLAFHNNGLQAMYLVKMKYSLVCRYLHL